MTSAPAARKGARSIHLFVSSMSAGGRSVSVGPSVVRALRAGGWRVSVTLTTQSDDPSALAGQARADVIAGLGGDGFISAIARGCHESASLFAPIPGGRGNDLCRALGIGADPLARARSLAELGLSTDETDLLIAQRTKPLDGMWVTEKGAEGRTLVLGVVSMGIDARANVLANESFLTSGPLAYGYGAFAALASFKPVPVKARIDGEDRDLTGWLASISNSGRIGGGIHLVPQSDLHDGLMEVCHVGTVPLRTVVSALVTVVAGRSRGHEEIAVETADTVEVLEPVGLVAMADGDRVAEVPFTTTRAPHVVDVLL